MVAEKVTRRRLNLDEAGGWVCGAQPSAQPHVMTKRRESFTMTTQRRVSRESPD